MDKVCNKCHLPKKYSDFYVNKALADGYNYACKLCEKAYQVEYKRKKREDAEFRTKENESALKRYHINSNRYNNNKKIRKNGKSKGTN